MNKNYWSALMTVVLCIAGGGLFIGNPAAKMQNKRDPLHGAAALEQLKQDGQYESLRAAVSATRRKVRRTAHSPSGRVEWHAPNPAAEYDAFVSEAGVSFAVNDDAYVSLHSYRLGYSTDTRPVGTVILRGASEQEIEYSKLVVRDNLGRNIQGWLKVESGKVVIEVDDFEAVYPLTIDPLFTLEKRLTASDASSQNYFGHSVALDSNTALISAPYDDVANADQGSAYVFVRIGFGR